MNKFIYAFTLLAMTLGFGCGGRTAWHGGYGQSQLGYGRTGAAYGQQSQYGPQGAYGQTGAPYGMQGYGRPGAMPGYYVSEYTGTSFDTRTAPAVAQAWFTREAIRSGRPIATTGTPPPQAVPSESSAGDASEDLDALRQEVIEQRRELHRLQQQIEEQDDPSDQRDPI